MEWPTPPLAFALALAQAFSSPPGLGAQSARFELEPPPGVTATPGDLVKVPLFLRLDAEGFKYVAFGIAAGLGSTISFAPSSDLTGLAGSDYYVDQVLDLRHISAGFGNFNFNDPALAILTPDRRIRLGTVNLTIDESIDLEEVSLAAGECACNDPGVSIAPVLHLGGNLKVEPASAAVTLVLGSHDYIRGDPNGDGVIDISDAIRVILDVFIDPGELSSCSDADDANDDGLLDVSDPIYLLSFLFQGGPVPPKPFPDRGIDPTDDFLTCRSPP